VTSEDPVVTDPVEATLFPKGSPQVSEQKELRDLYRLMVETSESLVMRRQAVNTFFLSINSLILGALGFLVRDGLLNNTMKASVVLISMAGIILCAVWRRMIVSYGLLNAGKFDIINRMEKHLPAAMFAAEWVALQNRKYKSFTKTECAVPYLFMLVYGAALLLGLYKGLCPLLQAAN